MKKVWKSSALLGAVVGGGLVLWGGSAQAVDLTIPLEVTINSTIDQSVVRGLNFGEIDLTPGGDTFVINASSQADDTNAAVEVSDTTLGALSGASGSPVAAFTSSSGLVVITSDVDCDIVASFPLAPVTLTGLLGGTVTVSSFTANSTTATSASPAAKTAGDDFNFHIGGLLTVLSGAENDTYSGDVTLTLTYQ